MKRFVLLRNGWTLRMYGASILFVAMFLLAGCIPSISEEEKEKIDTILLGNIQGRIVNNRIVDLWNEVYLTQLQAAAEVWEKQINEEYEKTRQADYLLLNGGLSELGSIFGSSYHDKYAKNSEQLARKTESLAEEFESIANKMKPALAKNFYATKSRIDELYAVYKEEKAFSDLGRWIDNPEFELLKTPFIESGFLYDPETEGIMETSLTNINLQNVFVQCLSTKENFKDCTPLYAYTMIYHYLVNMDFNIKRVYIVGVEDSENSYAVGYSNMEAYLCTLMGEGDSQTLVYEPIEFDQTLIGKGME